MDLQGTNERFRCYRYKPQMQFAPHADHPFHRSEQEQRFYRFIVYLNDGFERMLEKPPKPSILLLRLLRKLSQKSQLSNDFPGKNMACQCI